MAKWGRPGQGKSIVKDITNRNYVLIGDIYYPPSSPEAAAHIPKKKSKSKLIKTGWIDDTRNIRNKGKYQDPFIQIVKQELNLDVWPEFYFSTDRLYRLDYAIPEIKIGIEVNGGVWSKGNSGHSSGAGILRDYDKSNLAQSLGWRILTVIPQQVKSLEAVLMLKSYL